MKKYKTVTESTEISVDGGKPEVTETKSYTTVYCESVGECKEMKEFLHKHCEDEAEVTTASYCENLDNMKWDILLTIQGHDHNRLLKLLLEKFKK